MSTQSLFHGKKGELFTTLALLSLITIVFGTVIGTSTGVKSTVTKLFPKASEGCTFVNTLEVRGVNGTTFNTNDEFAWASEIEGGFKNPGKSFHVGSNPSIASLVADFPLGGTSNDFQDKKASVTLTVPEGFTVVDTFCEPKDGSTACAGFSSNAQKNIISDITLSCGGSIKYGWKIQRGGMNITPQPTQAPTTQPTTTTSGSGTAEVRLYVLQGNKVPDASFCDQVSSVSGMQQLQSAADTNGKVKSLFVTKYLATGERQAVPLRAINTATNESASFSKADDGGYNNIARKSLDTGTYNFTADIPENGSQLTPVCNDLKSNIAINNGATTPVPIIYYLTNQCRTDNSCKSEIKGIISGSGGRSRICCGAGSTPPPVGGNPGGGSAKACSAATCMYSQQDTDGQIRCYRGTCADGTENCTLAKDANGNVPVNQNCTFRQDCSVSAIQLQCTGANAGTPVAGGRSGGTPNPKPTTLPAVLPGQIAYDIAVSKLADCPSDKCHNIVVTLHVMGTSGAYVNPISTTWPLFDGAGKLKADHIKGHFGALTGSDYKIDFVISDKDNEQIRDTRDPSQRGWFDGSPVCNPTGTCVVDGDIMTRVKPGTLVYWTDVKLDDGTTQTTSDTQTVPVEVKIHRSLMKSDPGSPRFAIFTYPQWDNFPSSGTGETQIPSGKREIGGGEFLDEPSVVGDYYIYNTDLLMPTSGWPSISMSFGSSLITGQKYQMTHANCLDIGGDPTRARGRDRSYISKLLTDQAYENCFNVNDKKISLIIDPVAAQTAGANALVSKYKIDTQTIAKLDRIETQVCDPSKNCDTAVTPVSDVQSTTLVTFKNIKGQALNPDWNYELFCTLFYTDGTQSSCEGKSISISNPAVTRISSTIFGKTTLVTQTEFERADTNGDGVVNASDVAFLLANFGTNRADINYDDASDTLDLTTGYKWLGAAAR